MNDLIYCQEKHKLKYSELEEMQIIRFNKKKDLEDYLEKENLVIINNNFSEISKIINDFTDYKVYSNKIEIIFEDGIFQISTNNNIICLDSNNKVNNKDNINNNDYISKNEKNINHLIQLIRIYYFQEELIKQIKSPLSTKNNLYLLRKDKFNEYKNFFDYNKLYN